MSSFKVRLALRPITVDAGGASEAVAKAIDKLGEDVAAQVESVSAAPDAERKVGYTPWWPPQ